MSIGRKDVTIEPAAYLQESFDAVRGFALTASVLPKPAFR